MDPLEAILVGGTIAGFALAIVLTGILIYEDWGRYR